MATKPPPNRGKPAVISLIKSEEQRKKFYTLVSIYIQYNPYRSIIYSTCYPSTNTRFPEPVVGWNDSYSITEKYYFSEVLFYLHMYISSNEHSRECSQNRERFANNCNRTFELVVLLRRELREYISLDIPKLLESDGLLLGPKS